MVRPVDGQLSLLQAQNALELLQSAQREQAINQLKQEADTEKAKDLYQSTVTKGEEVEGKAIRDEDQRKHRERRQNPEEELGHEEQDQPPENIDIVV
jgi:hypothetical protein